METITELHQIQAVAFSILEEFDRFCREFHIDYYMAYGTLIGAIRHKGFIPWDDDIDVWVSRESYSRIMDLFPAWGRKRRLYLNSSQTTEGYNRIFAKVCLEDTEIHTRDRHNPYTEGLFIDIFVLDGSPNSRLGRFVHVTRLQTLRNLITLSAYGADQLPSHGRKEAVIGAVSRLFRGLDQRRLVQRYERLAAKAPLEKSDYVLVPIRRSKGRALELPRAWFDKTLDQPFQTMICSVPVGYDQILRHIYGDYMQLPPEDQRKPGHCADFYAEKEVLAFADRVYAEKFNGAG